MTNVDTALVSLPRTVGQKRGDKRSAGHESVGHVTARAFDPDAPGLSVLGVGCARLGSIRNYTPLSETKRMLALALDHGINVFDTANIYGQGDSEKILGRTVKGRRDEAFVITKIGYDFGRQNPLLSHLKSFVRLAAKHSRAFERKLGQTRESVISQDFSIEHLESALDGSLRRLELDTIDALLLHDVPATVLGDVKTGDFLRAARQEGKIRYFGASVNGIAEVEAALKIDGLRLLQVDVDTARALATHEAAKTLRSNRVGLLVREILQRKGVDPAAPKPDIAQALKTALEIPNVHSALVGLSSRKHLQAAIDAVS